MIIYRKPTQRRQHTVIAHGLTEITLSAGSTESNHADGIVLNVKGSPHENAQASKYLFQVLLEPDDLALLAAARERFNAGGDLPYRYLGLSVLPSFNAGGALRGCEPSERLLLLFSSYERDVPHRL